MSTNLPETAAKHPYLPPEIVVTRLRDAKHVASFDQIYALEHPAQRADTKQYASKPVTAVEISTDYNFQGNLISAGDKLVAIKQNTGETAWAHMFADYFAGEYTPMDDEPASVHPSAVLIRILSRLFPGRTIDDIDKLTADENLCVAFYNPDEHDVHLVPVGAPLNRELLAANNTLNLTTNKLVVLDRMIQILAATSNRILVAKTK